MKTDTVCVKCDPGTWRQVASTQSTPAESKSNVCKAHKICSAGQWTKAVGSMTTDTVCANCDPGTWRQVASSRSTPAESKSNVCKAHKICSAGQWTKAVGSITTDTVCSPCSAGRFREKAPTDNKAVEEESVVCQPHKTCPAGKRVLSLGTAVKDTSCTPCAPGTARSSSQPATSCPPCTGKSEYSDLSGLDKCRTCPVGHFGVVVAGSKADGGHKACDDDKCERPTLLPANSMIVISKCSDRGSQITSNCSLTCKPGFYSSGTNTPFTCAPDGKASTASYQGGAITCTGEF